MLPTRQTLGGLEGGGSFPTSVEPFYLQELNMTWRTPLTARTSAGSLLIKLGTIALLGVGMILATGACTVTTSTDGDPNGGQPSGGKDGGTGGAGGEGTGGDQSTGGTSTGGNGSGGDNTGGDNTGGSGGTIEPSFDCHDGGDVEGTLASTDPSDDDDDCWACVKATCADEFAECHAIVPHSVCGWDGFGEGDYGGEIECMFDCFDSLVADGAFLGTEVDVKDCAESCGASTCSTGEVTTVTRALASCAIEADDIAGFGCQAECGWFE